MPHLEVREHSLVLSQPRSLDDVFDGRDKAGERLGEECNAFITGWWEEHVHGHIAYLQPYQAIVEEDSGWLLTDNRGHWVRPLAANSGAVCAVEFVPASKFPSLCHTRQELERASPLGFGPTRMRPGWDVFECNDSSVLAEEQAHCSAEPTAATLATLKTTEHGAILERPRHTIEIDRVWHRLAQQEGLIPERDIEAYAIGWWQERDPRGGPYGVVSLAFDSPEPIWGFHHPAGTTDARWMYMDSWPIDLKPLPANAGPAYWAVEFVRRGHKPTLRTRELDEVPPRRKVDGISARSPANDPVVLEGGELARLSPAGRAIVSQPLPVLAGLCGLKDVPRIVAFVWDCATWVTESVAADEPWPVAHRRYWEYIWATHQRGRYHA